MVLYLGGEGGTGKSAVLRAVTTYMKELGVRDQMRLGSFTGVAAGNIGGSTLHSLLSLPVAEKKGKNKAPKPLPQSVVNNFKPVTVLFIDEVSMTGGTMLHKISKNISDAKETTLPFGGIDVIFAGDFYQLPPTTHDPLYNEFNYDPKKPTENTSEAKLGYTLFGRCTHVLFLTTQHRIQDAEYKKFVDKYRHGKATIEDENYCKLHVITKANSLSTGHLRHLAEDPLVIVKSNELRYHINNVKAKQHAASLGQKLLINVAIDSGKQAVTVAARREMLLMYDGPLTTYAAGLLPLFIGMLVMMKVNTATELGISNGSPGVISNIILDPREVIDYTTTTPHFLKYQPLAIYVTLTTEIDPQTKLPLVRFQLPNLEPNVFMLYKGSGDNQQ